ncbi:cytochrome B [Limnohabitans sp. 2KL-17]|uniref:cytochrome b/b6 domain-containing protein n=1 Tax=Limnohabitans sp. 2KL-17 TaxID=1100704 RepID=UPI000D370CFC|nr:cytochrome b/b6 domain-containing protein [Limnohabitans sp. 2KL-17]PUE50183.1 cytochrome B [Limnohabitans sp. 2KL-17]
MFTVRIWDLPTRVFHWSLAVCVVGLVITGNVGGDAMAWHFRLGYAVLTLVLFRLVWGVFGGYWSRWSQLPVSPTSVLAYTQVSTSTRHLAGHSPLGSWSVLALMLFLSLQVATGLVSDDEIANMGPLSSLVPDAWVSLATSWHKNWGKLILIVLVVSHLLAIAWYRWGKQQPLVPAMWHGDKTLPEAVTPSRDNGKSRSLAVALFIAAGVVVAAIVPLGG